MQYRIIPKTDLEVSRICLGTMTFGIPVPEAEAIRLVHYAYDKGINFIDTANMYEGYARVPGSSGGVAEEFVGKAVKGVRSRYIIATKLGMKVGESSEDEFTSPKAIEKQLHRSLKNLSTDYIDVYYLHKYDPNTPPEEICLAMNRQIKAGYIRSYAVSNYTASQLSALINAAQTTGVPGPVLCQPSLSLLNTTALDHILPLCQKENLGVVPYQVLEGGLLTGKYRRGESVPAGSRADEKPDWVKTLDDELFDKLELFQKKAEEKGLSLAQYSIAWALNQPAVLSALVGVKRESQIDEAVSAIV